MQYYRKISDLPAIGTVQPVLADSRLDADYYKPVFIENKEHLLSSGLKIKRLGDMWIEANYGSLPDSTDYSERGISLIRGTDITRFTIAPEENLVKVPEEYFDKFKKARVWPGEILLLVKGASIDRPDSAAIVPESVNKAIINGSVFRVKLKGEYNIYFVAAFMFSDFFLQQKRRAVTNTGAYYNDLDAIKSYIIPIPDSEIQTYIGDKVRLAEKCREEAQSSIQVARGLLIRTIGFDLYDSRGSMSISASGEFYKVINSSPACVGVCPPLLGNAITAERYLPIDLAKDETLRSYQVRLAYLGDIAEAFINGYDCRDFKPEGTPYIKVANIGPNELVLSRVQFVSPKVTSLNRKFQMLRGDLLITRKGSFGICTTVLPRMEEMIFSSEIIRVPLKKGWDSDYVALFLNSPFGRYQFDRLATGTTMKGINHENLSYVGVPKLDIRVQEGIGANVRRFMRLIERAKGLISEAKTNVEKLIEGKLDTEGIKAGRIRAPTWEEIEAELTG
jgi:type I restriction enzyme S subunit